MIKPLKALLCKTNQVENFVYAPLDSLECTRSHQLYKHPLNSIHLSYPQNYSLLQKSLETIKKNCLIETDTPSFYSYRQTYTHPISLEQKTRTGFFCHIVVPQITDRLKGHEAVIEKYVEEKKKLLEITGHNTLPTFGLYKDDNNFIEEELAKSLVNPIIKYTDEYKVIHELGMLSDDTVIGKIEQLMLNKRIILADGHHRLAASQKLAKERGQEINHLIFLSNYHFHPPTIRPFIRLFKPLKDRDWRAKLQSVFDTIALEIKTPPTRNEDSFHIITDTISYECKCDWSNYQSQHQCFVDEVIGKVFEHSLDMPVSLTYANHWEKAVEFLKEGYIACMLPGYTMKQIEEIISDNMVLAEKSTYFYPKIVSGFLMSDIACEV